MRLPKQMGPEHSTRLAIPDSPAARRDRLAVLVALATIVCLGAVFILSRGTEFLMPGPLTSAHATIEECSACHTSSGTGKVSWLRGLVPGDRLSDSRACVACHRMPDTAFNAHGAGKEVLAGSTERLSKVGAQMTAPRSARAQSFAFPTDGMVASGLTCATCHQEHRGVAFDLKKASDAQCTSCHVAKFDSFDGRHPEFARYPYKRRTRIIYDHGGHFSKHFPEIAKKDPTKRIPETCSTCHESGRDKRVMTVAPFEQTCATCHLDQILGKERLSGPKGIAFLAIPGIDLQTLAKSKADIGEWPAASEAGLTPFMKLMIGRHQQGRALIEVVDKIDLQDLRKATDDQIVAVTSLVWEIKRLFHELIKGKASDVLAGLDIADPSNPRTAFVTTLIASIPLDVVIGAQQQWLPNLGAEMANRASSSSHGQGGWTTSTVAPRVSGIGEPPGKGGRPVQAQAKVATGAATETVPANASAGQPATGSAKKAPSPSGKSSLGAEPPPKAADQTDDLLFPTEAELRASKAGTRNAGKPAPVGRGIGSAEADGTVPARAGSTDTASIPIANAVQARSRPAAVTALKSDVDPESWAEHGGWYRQDFVIFYRATGHKDNFITAWLRLTGGQASKNAKSPAAAVFNALAAKDAQGSCTKCHSIDGGEKERIVNFSPLLPEGRNGRFTSFSHGPHMSIVGERGCLTCHSLENGRAYLESYQQGDPQRHDSNFADVKKDVCGTCHAGGKVRQDCLTCHTYHVNGMVSSVPKTKIPVH